MMNNLLEYKGYYGTVEFSAADNILFGTVLGINRLISFEGNSIKNLKNDFEGAIDDYLDMCEGKGIDPEKAYRGEFNIQVSPELHKTLVIYSAVHGKSVNSTVEEAIRYYLG